MDKSFGFVIFIMVVATGLLGILLIGLFDGSINENAMVRSCAKAKLSITQTLLLDIKRQSENQQLCPDKECELYFGNEINKSRNKIDEVLNNDCVERMKEILG